MHFTDLEFIIYEAILTAMVLALLAILSGLISRRHRAECVADVWEHIDEFLKNQATSEQKR